MTQQEFAERTQIGAATLSNIFNDRTRPTLNVVELIKKNVPDISTDWLLLGVGDMYVSRNQDDDTRQTPTPEVVDQVLPFGSPATPTPISPTGQMAVMGGKKVVRNDTAELLAKLAEKPQRKVTEIRVYYDDQTWESFVPAKSKG